MKYLLTLYFGRQEADNYTAFNIKENFVADGFLFPFTNQNKMNESEICVALKKQIDTQLWRLNES